MVEGNDIELPDESYYEPVPDAGTRWWLVALLAIAAVILLCCMCAFATMVVVALLSPATVSRVLDIFGVLAERTALL
jgi:hypothetical protein